MAVKYAVTGGNWSNAAIWNGGTKPQAGDDVYPNANVVYCDEDFTVNALLATPSVDVPNPGGYFYVSGGIHNYTIIDRIEAYANYLVYIYNYGSTTTVTVGTLKGGAYGGAHAVYCDTGGVATFNVLNMVTGGSNYAAYGLYTGIGNYTVINGEVRGDFCEGYAVNHGSYGTLIINGDSYAGSKGYSAILNANYGTLILNGFAIPSINAPGLQGAIINTTKVKGAKFLAGKYMPILGIVYFLPNAETIVETHSTDGSVQILLQDVSEVDPQTMPIELDVRKNTSYARGTKVGSLSVPAKNMVSIGVPVDNDFGTAQLRAEDFLNAIQTSDHPLAERLRNVSTVQTTAETIENSL